MIPNKKLFIKNKDLIGTLIDLYREYQKNNLTAGGYYGTATLDQFIKWLAVWSDHHNKGD